MRELIKISQELIGDETVNSVDARELYETLELTKDFSNWIKSQIKSLGLEENIDYITFKQSSTGGRPTTEYILTTDTAKHISMASRTPKGKEVRSYFIAIEKEFIKELQNAKAYIAGGYKSQIAQRNTKIKLLESIIKDSEARQNLMSKKYLMDEDCDFKQQIEHLLKQTQEELNNTPTSEWTFFQNRSNYFITYIKAMRVGGSELQRFTSELIDKALSDRNKAENKYMNLEQKYNTLKNSIDRCCNNVA